jgi:hypothetical protein
MNGRIVRRERRDLIGWGILLALLALGAARFLTSGLLPATRSLSGDFAAVFPTRYFAQLRPDFPTDAVWSGWRYGPMVHFLTLPLFLVPKWSLVPSAWAAVNLTAIAIGFVLVRRLASAGRVSWATTLALASGWFFYQPLANCFAQGNVEIVEMALILAAIVALPRWKGVVSGILIGVATMIKFLPVGFLCWFLLRRHRTAFLAGLATIGVILVATTLTLGWKEADPIWDMTGGGGATKAGVQELSITSLFLHRTSVLLHDAGATGVQASPAPAWFPSERAIVASNAGLLASLLLAAGIGLLLVFRRRQPSSPAEVAVLFMTMFMILPWNHDYYYVFALVPLSVLFIRAVERRDRALMAAVAIGYLLISPPIPFRWIDRTGWLSLSFADVFNYLDLPIVGALIVWIAATQQMLAETPIFRLTTFAKAEVVSRKMLLAVALAVLAGSAWLALSRRAPVAQVTAGPFNLEPAALLSGPPALALSPGGAFLAYVAQRGGVNVLCVHARQRATTTCIPGTEDAAAPFFAPDGRAIAFFAGGSLKRVRVDGTELKVLAESQGARTGHWAADDTILIATANDGITGMPAAGGNMDVIVPQLPTEGTYAWPSLLPSQTVLFVAPPNGGGLGAGSIMAFSRRTGQRKLLFSGTQPYFDAPSGRLHYTLGGRALSVAFDPDTLRPSGPAAPVAADVLVTRDGGPQLAYGGGAFAHAAGNLQPVVRREMVWVDRAGITEPVAIAADAFQAPRISPDGRLVATLIRDVITDLWKYDLGTGAKTRLTFSAATHQGAVWSPEGEIAFNVPIGSGAWSTVLVIPPGGTALEASRLWSGPGQVRLGGWAGKSGVAVGTQSGDLWILDPGGLAPAAAATGAPLRAGSPRDRWRVILSQTAAIETGPVISPDGRYIAYSSTESGQPEIYVQTPLGFAERRKMSEGGGTEPVWSRDGSELFYRSGDAMMAVRAGGAGASQVVLFRGAYAGGEELTNYDVGRDGRFLMLREDPAGKAGAATLSVKPLRSR